MFLFIQNIWANVWPNLSSPPKTNETSNDVALIVSIEDYFFVSDIEGALQNGRDWYEFFSRSKGLLPHNIVLLENEKATKEAIEGEAEKLSKILTKNISEDKNGTIWFVYIGHGAPSFDGKDGLLLGSDVQQTAKSIDVRSVSQKHILHILEGEHSHKNEVIAFIDACFSGRDTSGESIVPNLQPLIATRDIDVGSSTVLSAARHDEFAGPLAGLNRPAFSYLALGGLQGWADENKDGYVTSREVTEFSRNTLLAVNQDRTQTPTILGEETDISISKAFLEPPDIGVIRLQLLPKNRNPNYLIQKSIAGGFVVGGISFLTLGTMQWQNAMQQKEVYDYAVAVKKGDEFSAVGLSSLVLGSTGLVYFIKKTSK